MNYDSQAARIFIWARRLGLICSGLAFGLSLLMLTLITYPPGASYSDRFIMFFILFTAPLTLIFRGFFIFGDGVKRPGIQAGESFAAILITIFTIVSGYAFFSQPSDGLILFVYLVPIILIFAGFYNFKQSSDDRHDINGYAFLLSGIYAGINIGIVLFFLNFAPTWLWLPFLIYTLPGLFVLTKRKQSGIRSSFLVWSGLGNMIMVMLYGIFSIGFYYLPIYILLTVLALFTEFVVIKSN